jgi:hypothetical protein
MPLFYGKHEESVRTKAPIAFSRRNEEKMFCLFLAHCCYLPLSTYLHLLLGK